MIQFLKDRRIIADVNGFFNPGGVERFGAAFKRELSRCKTRQDIQALFDLACETFRAVQVEAERRSAQLTATVDEINKFVAEIKAQTEGKAA